MKEDYKKIPPTKSHMILYVCTVLGQITCGYIPGITGTVVTQTQGELGLSTFWVGLLEAGALIGLAESSVVGNIADKIGRSRLMLADIALLSVCSVPQLFTPSAGVLVFLRICISPYTAVDYTVGTTIISEWFPPKDKPVYLSRFIIFWTFGYVASFFAGLIMGNLSMDYHTIFITSVIPGVIAAITRTAIGVPESPTWLATIDRSNKADKLVAKKPGDGYCVVARGNNVSGEKVSVVKLFSPKYHRNTLIGGVSYACQVSPYFGVDILLPILTTSLNMRDANISSVLYDVFCMAGAFIGTYLHDRISWRCFLCSIFYIPAVALGVVIVGHGGSMAATVVSFRMYALSISIAIVMEGPYPSELSDTRVRDARVGTVTAPNRIGAATGILLLPILVERIGVCGTLDVCLAILLISGVVCQLFAPETFIKEVHTAEVNENLATN